MTAFAVVYAAALVVGVFLGVVGTLAGVTIVTAEPIPDDHAYVDAEDMVRTWLRAHPRSPWSPAVSSSASRPARLPLRHRVEDRRTAVAAR